MYKVKVDSAGTATHMTLQKWFVNEGDSVGVGDIVCRVHFEDPRNYPTYADLFAQCAGKIHILKQIGETVQFGAAMATIG